MAVPRFDYFDYGRKEAGMGWYKPQAPGWLLALGEFAKKVPTAVGAGMGAYGEAKLNADDAARATPGAVPGAMTASPGATARFDSVTPPGLGGFEPPSGEVLYGTPPGLGGPEPPPGEYQFGQMTDPATGRPRLTPQQRRRYLQMLLMSSRVLKDNVNRADERRSLREVMDTPTYRYRYVDEPEGTQSRLGPMAEEVPERWRVTEPRSGLPMIKMPAYLGALHASVRALGRDVKTLKEQLRG